MMYRLSPKSFKKDFVFNMLGSLSNSAVSVILLVVVSRLTGDSSAGIFSLAYSSAQMMYTIGVFEMRNIQVTDVKNEFSFSNIFSFRIITLLLMWLFCIVFISVKGFVGQKAIAIIMLCAYMSLLALSDVFQGNAHINGYLFIAGRSLSGNVILASLGFSISLLITRNLIFSLIFLIILPMAWIIFYDIPYNRNFSQIKLSMDSKVFKRMLFYSLPLFIVSFLQQYTFNMQKYAIDRFLTDIDQSHYGYLIMPAFFINLLSIFVFRPQLVPLSKDWEEGNFKKFKKAVILLYFWIGIVTLFALTIGYFIGIPSLEFLYGANLSGKRTILLILLFSGSMGACCSLTSTLITILRKQKFALIPYGIVFCISVFLPNILVLKFGLLGVSVAYLIEMAMLFIGMMTLFLIFLKQRQRGVSYGAE